MAPFSAFVGLDSHLSGYLRTMPVVRGGGRPPRAICQTTGPILGPKTVFDNPGHQLSEYIANLYLKVTENVAAQVIGQIFTICHRWLRRAKWP